MIKSYNQIVDIELTTDQVLLCMAMVATSKAEMARHAEVNGDKYDDETKEEVEETNEMLDKLMETFADARKRIEQSWSE